MYIIFFGLLINYKWLLTTNEKSIPFLVSAAWDIVDIP